MSVGQSLDPTRLGDAFEVVAGQVRDGQVPAAVLAVARGHGMVRCEAFQHDGGDRVAPDSVFMVASITKPIVATAVMQLVEAGRLVLSAPLATYIPEFAPPPAAPGGESVTVWHVLTHTAGIEDFDATMLARERPRPADLLRRACTRPLLFRPGSRHAYVSGSFYLLAEVIERLSGMPFARYLHERVTAPLGMTNTAFDPPADRDRRVRVRWLGVPEMLVEPAVAYLASIEMPGGGLWSTASDLVSFGMAMLAGGRLGTVRVLGQPFVDLMTRDHTVGITDEATGLPAHYGLGWGKPGLSGCLPASAASFGHGGATGTRLLVDPDADLVVAYLANDWQASMLPSQEATQAVYAALD